MFLESYTSVHCTASNSCTQRSRTSLTPIHTFHRLLCKYMDSWASTGHRLRKILKVGGAQYIIARVVHAKIFRPRPFLHNRSYCDHAAKSFLMKERILSIVE